MVLEPYRRHFFVIRQDALLAHDFFKLLPLINGPISHMISVAHGDKRIPGKTDARTGQPIENKISWLYMPSTNEIKCNEGLKIKENKSLRQIEAIFGQMQD
jgi:hypothetical protein